jgi:hypothetical protein
MRSARHVACGREAKVIKILIWTPEQKRPLSSLGVDVRVILKWVIKKYVGRVLNGSLGPG